MLLLIRKCNLVEKDNYVFTNLNSNCGGPPSQPNLLPPGQQLGITLPVTKWPTAFYLWFDSNGHQPDLPAHVNVCVWEIRE